MKLCTISLPLKLIVVSPAPSSRLSILQTLIARATEEWEGLKCDTELLIKGHNYLLQQIANLLPRMDVAATEKCTGWDVKEMTAQQVQDFFFYRQEQGEVILSDLMELHQSTIEVNPQQELEPIEGEDIGDWMPPIPSCGDTEIDLFGQLLSVFGVVGVELCDRFDQNSLNLLIQAYNNSQQDPEVRRREYMAKFYNDYKEQNGAAIQRALGLDDFDPRKMMPAIAPASNPSEFPGASE